MDSSMVVECPLDILMRYFYRVQDRAWRMPYPLALDWIWRHDEAERTVWVDRYRNSQETLGEVIKHCLITREAMWEIPLPVSRPPRPEADKPPGATPKRKPQKPAGGGGGKTPKGADAPNAETLRDGSRLCRSFTPAIAQGRIVLTSASAARSSMVAACAAPNMQLRITVETHRPPRSRPRGAGPVGRQSTDLPQHWTYSLENMHQ